MSAPLPIHSTTPDLDGLRMVVAAVLKSPEKDFDLGTWKCQTTACAIGWFCTYNPGDALKLVPRPGFHGAFMPECQGLSFFPAVAIRFRISVPQAHNLFGNCHEFGFGPQNRRELLERLEQFIVDNTPEHVIPDLHELRGGRSRVTDVFSLDLLTDAEVAAFAPANVDEQPLVLGSLNAQAYDEAHQRADAQDEDGERWSGLE